MQKGPECEKKQHQAETQSQWIDNDREQEQNQAPSPGQISLSDEYFKKILDVDLVYILN
jgi:hypothetical protein